MRQWLYNEDGGKIFKGDEIAEASKNGYVDSPAKVGKATEDVAPPKSPVPLTVDELKEMYTVKELKDICKNLGITGMSRKKEQECAQAIFDHESNKES